jgi:hypothetical protein
MIQRVIVAMVVAFATLCLAAPSARAGACGSDSDCAGVGKCSNGQCGSCGSDSDCHGHGKCSSGKCGACGSDSDCSHGTCSSGRCGSCGSDSDCKGNGKCSSGKCGSCGSDSDCKGGRCSSGRCSNALSTNLDWLLAPEHDCGESAMSALQLASKQSCSMAPADAPGLLSSGFEALMAKLAGSAVR